MKILEVRLIPGQKVLRALADLEFHEWVIRDFRVAQHYGQPLSVEPPKITWKESDTGLIKFKPIVLIPCEDKKIVEAEILSEYRKTIERTTDRREKSYEGGQRPQE